MNKEFVPYELALELKQLGFDEPCFGVYATKDGYVRKSGYDENGDAPTYSQAFRFFREKHDLYINITKYNDENDTQDKFYYYISDGCMKEEFNTYEEAELECIKKLIEIVNDKQ